MNSYLNVFIDKTYPSFIDKYLETSTLKRLKHVTQFCGCDYTKLYSPLFLFTRFDHSLVVAHMTWHFTQNKKETIIALLHDVGTPCFAHSIDVVFGDTIHQESSERKITDMIKKDKKIMRYLKEDGISLDDFNAFSAYPILENTSPKLCTDRLDGVLHTCYIWIHTHSLKEIKEVYDDLVVLKNEENTLEIGFKNIRIAEKFVGMVSNYAKELQGNRDKYTMKYIAEMVKLANTNNLITIEDLYTKKEEEICAIFNSHFSSWKKFREAQLLISTDKKPLRHFYASFETKKRNTIPLVLTPSGNKRVNDLSPLSKDIYHTLNNYKDTPYAYVEEIKKLN